MTPENVLLLGAVLLGLLVVRSLVVFPFEVYWLCALIREQRPEEWAVHGGGMSALPWIASLVFGRAKLDIPGKSYARRLSYIRWSLCLAPIYLAVTFGMIGWALAQG